MNTGCFVNGCTRPLRTKAWCGYHAPPMAETREDLASLPEIDKSLRRITGTLRIITASQLLESGHASSWPEAVRMARGLAR